MIFLFCFKCYFPIIFKLPMCTPWRDSVYAATPLIVVQINVCNYSNLQSFPGQGGGASPPGLPTRILPWNHWGRGPQTPRLLTPPLTTNPGSAPAYIVCYAYLLITKLLKILIFVHGEHKNKLIRMYSILFYIRIHSQ